MKNKTVNKKEIDKFSKLAREWWDPNGKFKPLHKFNPVRLDYIKKSILKKLKKRDDTYLKNVKILDIGCGGGLLCEPLTRLGAQVVGVQAGGAGYNLSLAFDGNLSAAYLLGVNSASTGGSNYTHTPTINSSGTIYGLSITYLTD